MSKVEFNLNGNITSILCSENDLMSEICKKFAIKTQTNLDNLIFLYSGNKINLKLTLSQIMNHIDRQRRTISILVNEINSIVKSANLNSGLVKSKIPICPECSETTMFTVSNYKISLSDCKNKHQKEFLINEYEKTQFVDLNKIICSQCKTTKKTLMTIKCIYVTLVKKYFVLYAGIIMIKNILLLIMIKEILYAKDIVNHIILIVVIAELIYA